MTTASYVRDCNMQGMETWEQVSKQNKKINKNTQTQVEVEWHDLFQFTGC
jgi:hypothetical protein